MSTAPLTPLAGPYAPPKCRRDDKLFCQFRDAWVTVGGLSDSPVTWPYMKARGRHSPILTGDLVRAVQVEASMVVCHLFGVTPQSVTKWRAALEVPHATPGTSERMAAPKRGVARPAHVVAILRRKGRTLSAAHRAKLSAANLRNGTRPDKDRNRLWTAREDALLVRLRPKDVVKRTGRMLSAVYTRRYLLDLPDGWPGRVVGLQ